MKIFIIEEFAGTGDIDGSTPTITFNDNDWVGGAAPLDIGMTSGHAYAISATGSDAGEAVLGDPTGLGVDEPAEHLRIAAMLRTGPDVTWPAEYRQLLTLNLGFKGQGYAIYIDNPAGDWTIHTAFGGAELVIDPPLAPDTDYTFLIEIEDGVQRFYFQDQVLTTDSVYVNPEGFTGLRIALGPDHELSYLSTIGDEEAVLPVPVMRMEFEPYGFDAALAGTIAVPVMDMRIVPGEPGNTISATIPVPTMQLQEGAALAGTIAVPVMDMRVLTTIVVDIQGTIAAPSMLMTMLATGMAVIDGIVRVPTMRMDFGADVQGEIAAPSFTMDMLGGGTMALAGVIPVPSILVELLSVPTIQIVATIAAPAAGPYGDISATIPVPRLMMQIVSVIEDTFAAYAINLKHSRAKPNELPIHEMTEYTNYPFVQGILRYGGEYLGVAAAGVYRLTGTTDDDEPIDFAVRTHLSDFGTPDKKTAVSVYMTGRLGDDMALTLYAGENVDNLAEYAFTTPRDTDPQNYRQKFGKGVKAYYFGFGAQGSNAFELAALDFLIADLTRKV